jgi:hypothetical protein
MVWMSQDVKKEKIYFSIPSSNDEVPQQFASTFAFGLAELVRKHPEVDFGLSDYMSNLQIAAARNREIHLAIQGGADWIWFLDTDHRFPPGSFPRLWETAMELREKNPSDFLEVSALYYGRTGDHPPMGPWLDHPDLMDPEKWKAAREAGQVVNSRTVPTGCTLINLRNARILYDKMANRGNALYNAANSYRDFLAKRKKASPDELAKLNNLICKAVGFQPVLFIGQYDPFGRLVTTEDYYFSANATSEGFSCWIDLGCQIEHKIRDYWFPPHRDSEPVPRPDPQEQFVIRGPMANGLVCPTGEKIAPKTENK